MGPPLVAPLKAIGPLFLGQLSRVAAARLTLFHVVFHTFRLASAPLRFGFLAFGVIQHLSLNLLDCPHCIQRSPIRVNRCLPSGTRRPGRPLRRNHPAGLGSDGKRCPRLA
jgi:hypothetical protein